MWYQIDCNASIWKSPNTFYHCTDWSSIWLKLECGRLPLQWIATHTHTHFDAHNIADWKFTRLPRERRGFVEKNVNANMKMRASTMHRVGPFDTCSPRVHMRGQLWLSHRTYSPAACCCRNRTVNFRWMCSSRFPICMSWMTMLEFASCVLNYNMRQFAIVVWASRSPKSQCQHGVSLSPQSIDT